MANSNTHFNLGVFSCIQIFFCYVVFFSVVLLHANTTQENTMASTICPKTRNSSLCWRLLKPMGSMDGPKLANYTLSLSLTTAVEALRHARQLEATNTTDPQLNKRYSECSRRFNSAVEGLEQGKEALATGGYVVLTFANMAFQSEADECLGYFKQPPPEPSSLPEKAKDLGDISDIAAWVSSILAGDDYGT